MPGEKLSKYQEVQKIQRNRKQPTQNIRRNTGNRKIVERRKVCDEIKRSTEALLEDVYIAVIIEIGLNDGNIL
jgi:hypothetical protein